MRKIIRKSLRGVKGRKSHETEDQEVPSGMDWEEVFKRRAELLRASTQSGKSIERTVGKNLIAKKWHVIFVKKLPSKRQIFFQIKLKISLDHFTD